MIARMAVTDPAPATRAAPNRVRDAHRQARTGVQACLGFTAAALLATIVPHETGRWLPLHLFLAGALVLAISSVSWLLTTTWAAAPAPADAVVVAQRVLVGAGAAGIAFGRELDAPVGFVAVSGSAFVCGLGLLAVILVQTARAGVQRRYDVAVVAYVAALVAGAGGSAVGVAMAVDGASSELRAAHVALNALGLVGLVIIGTLPFFAATVGRTKMSAWARPRRLVTLVAGQVAAVAFAASALATGTRWLAAIALAAYAAGVVATLAFVPFPTRRQLRWAGPRLIALWAGGAWWALAVAATAVSVAAGRSIDDGPWLLVLVVAGYAQILWGALAYLLPVLRGGGHERLAAGFATTRSWVGLGAVNGAGLALALGAPFVAAAAVAVWATDSAVRIARMYVSRSQSKGALA
jgi:nitrite reductase (NO-forming)